MRHGVTKQFSLLLLSYQLKLIKMRAELAGILFKPHRQLELILLYVTCMDVVQCAMHIFLAVNVRSFSCTYISYTALLFLLKKRNSKLRYFLS